MSSPPSSTVPKNDQQIRSRLLNRLGIYDSQPAKQPMTAAQNRRLRILRGMGVGAMMHHSPPDGSAVRPPLDGVQVIKEPLNDEEDPESSDSPPDRKSRIAFQEQVEVVPIPTRYEYSDRIKSRIWSNRHELQENAERNALEFAAEGWNWRSVTEDEGMYICSQSGELVHPVHCQHLLEKPHLERGDPAH